MVEAEAKKDVNDVKDVKEVKEINNYSTKILSSLTDLNKLKNYLFEMRKICCELCKMNFKEKYTKKSIIRTTLKVCTPFNCKDCDSNLKDYRLFLRKTAERTGIVFLKEKSEIDINQLELCLSRTTLLNSPLYFIFY